LERAIAAGTESTPIGAYIDELEWSKSSWAVTPVPRLLAAHCLGTGKSTVRSTKRGGGCSVPHLVTSYAMMIKLCQSLTSVICFELVLSGIPRGQLVNRASLKASVRLECVVASL
jgi:hypothetical protein